MLMYDEQDEQPSATEPQPDASPSIMPPSASFGFDGPGRTPKVAPTPIDGKPPRTPRVPNRKIDGMNPRRPAVPPAPGAGYEVAKNFGFGQPVLKAPGSEVTAQAGAPAGGSTQGYLEGGLNDWLNNPSRYGSDVVKQGASVIEQSLAKLRKQGNQSIAENAASRGLVGSSVEQENMLDYEAELQRQGQERLFNLQREQANTYGADRSASIAAGLGFGDQSINLLGMGMDNDFRWAQMQNDSGFRNMAMQLQAQGMTADDAYRHAALAWQKQYGTGELDLRRQGVNSQNNLALAQLLMSNPDLLDDPTMGAWIKQQFQGGGGGGGSAPHNPGYWGGDQPSSGSQMMPNLNNFTGSGATPYYGYGEGFKTANGGGPNQFGFTPQSVPGQPNYGVTQEGQRRLGMPQTPLPNGITSPMPGSPGGGYGGGAPTDGQPGGGGQFGFTPPPNGMPTPEGYDQLGAGAIDETGRRFAEPARDPKLAGNSIQNQFSRWAQSLGGKRDSSQTGGAFNVPAGLESLFGGKTPTVGEAASMVGDLIKRGPNAGGDPQQALQMANKLWAALPPEQQAHIARNSASIYGGGGNNPTLEAFFQDKFVPGMMGGGVDSSAAKMERARRIREQQISPENRDMFDRINARRAR